MNNQTKKGRSSLSITAAIFIGLILGILFGLFMPASIEGCRRGS